MKVTKEQILSVLNSYRAPKSEDLKLCDLLDMCFDGKEEVDFLAEHITTELNKNETTP